MVQLAFLQYDADGTLTESGDFIIRPDGFVIPDEAARIHGITQSRALREGQPLQVVLEKFGALVAGTEYLVAHNMAFDEKIAGAEFLRAGMPNPLQYGKRLCTMQLSTDYCHIPGNYGNKWPTLTELHFRLFGSGFREAHNAAADIIATARCFWELRKRGVL